MRRSLLIFTFVIFLISVLAGCASDVEVIKVRFVESPQGLAAEPASSSSTQPALNARLVTASRLADCLSYYKSHDFASCRTGVENYLSENPAGWQGYYLLALLDYNSEDYAGAERSFQASLRFSPVDPKMRAAIYSALGQTFEVQGKTGLSKQHYMTALNLDPGLLAAREGIARLTSLTSADQ